VFGVAARNGRKDRTRHEPCDISCDIRSDAVYLTFSMNNGSLTLALTAQSTIYKKVLLNQHKGVLLLGHFIPSRRKIRFQDGKKT